VIRINHLTKENLQKEFSLNPSVLHLSGHGILFNNEPSSYRMLLERITGVAVSLTNDKLE
jgi:hypothetical protein